MGANDRMSVIQLVQVGARVGPGEAVFEFLLALIVVRHADSIVSRFCCSRPWLSWFLLHWDEVPGAPIYFCTEALPLVACLCPFRAP